MPANMLRVLGLVLLLWHVVDAVPRVIQGPSISSLNVLLPPRTSRSVSYRLHGSHGCFSWSWDHHDLLSVQAEYNGSRKHCSTSALLTAIVPYSGRKATAVHATDTLTGQVLRCEVFIDVISRIQIFHHSLKLDLDGLATLRIRGFDSEENVFSSLGGLHFLWRLSPMHPSGDLVDHRLAHVPLKDSFLIHEEIESQIELELTGLDSDVYVVRGISAGQERVTAQLMEPHVETLADVVVLTVAEAFSLDPPSPLYIIPGTQLQYSLKTIRRNVMTTVDLPSPHHLWSIANSSVAEIDSLRGYVSGRTHGSTIVVVEDTRVMGHQQTSTLYVVTPVSLKLFLSVLSIEGAGAGPPFKEPPVMSSDIPWELVVGRKYVVQVSTFSQESGTRPLQLTKEVDLRRIFTNKPVWAVDDIPEDVAIEQGWKNCSLLHALSEGSGILVATLAHGSMVLDEASGQWVASKKEVLRVEQKVRVCRPVHIILKPVTDLSFIVLPWIPEHNQEYSLSVEGGCGARPTDYWWSSSNLAVATVDALGVVRSQGLGKAMIRVAPLRGSLNIDEVVVEVSVPSSMTVIPKLPVEAAVGSLLPVAVILQDSAGLKYSQCDAFDAIVVWELSGGEASFLLVNRTSSFVPHQEESEHYTAAALEKEVSESGPCAWALLLAIRPGRCTVTAAMHIMELAEPNLVNIGGLQILQTSWTVAAYRPLSLDQASDGNSHGGYAYQNDESEVASEPKAVHGSLKELYLTLGSSMRVVVQGGPDRWRQGVDFLESCLDASEATTILPGSAGSKLLPGVMVQHLTEGSGRLYMLTCVSLGSYTLMFQRGNLIGEDHPRQAVATETLSVVCTVPSSIVLIIDEPENNLSAIRSAAHADRDASRRRSVPFTVINRRTIRVAAVALHKSGRPFANASSLFLNWLLNDCDELAYWKTSQKGENTVVKGTWEHFLVLGNKSGECFITAEVGPLISTELLARDTLSQALTLLGKGKPNLRDKAPLQLVSALQIEPKSILLFYHPDAKGSLVVVGGTTDVETHTNDSMVVALARQQPTSNLLLTLVVGARSLGTALVTVKDVGLATPSEASALVYVSDIAWVRMLLPEDASLLLGRTLAVELEAGDAAGHVFDPLQFLYMDVEVHVQDEILEVVSLPKSTGEATRGNVFVVLGASVGLTTTLHVSVQQQSGQEILSDFGRISVYAPLLIYPPRLVLAPGSQYVVVAKGGPRMGVTVEFSSSDSEIVSIDKFNGRLLACLPGNVIVHAKAWGQGGHLISEASIEVRVQVPDIANLNVRGGQLGVGREMSVFPTGAEDLFSFLELCRDYKWSISDEQVLVLRHSESRGGQEHSMQEESGDNACRDHALSGHVYGHDGFLGSEEGFSARILGRSAGRTKVTVVFSCEFGDDNSNIVPKVYTASDTVWVVPDPPLALGMPATWLLKPQYTSSCLLPQWSGQFAARTDVGNTGRSVVYSVMHEGSNDLSVISILPGGLIRTADRLELACIQGRDSSTGRAEVAACVRVAEVAQVMVGGDDFPYHVAEMSVGSIQKYSVRLSDEFGIPFFESGRGPNLITVETNRIDIVSVKVTDCEQHEGPCNASVTAQALRQGTALVRLSYRNIPHIADYILIKVGAFVSPRNPSVHVGGCLNFTIIGKGLHVAGLLKGERGHWASSNDNVLEIDSRTGQAKATGEGVVVVSFIGSRLTTYTSVTVTRVAVLTIEAPKGSEWLTNVPLHDEDYRFPITFSDTRGRDVGVLGDKQEVSYECQVDPSFIGVVVPWQEPGFTRFYCAFIPFPPHTLWYNAQSLQEKKKLKSRLEELNGTLQMTVSATVPGAPSVTGSVEVSLVGGFEIVNTPDELHLSPTTNRSLIVIVGSTRSIEVKWERTDVMVVDKIKDDSDGIAARAVFEVKLISINQPFTDRVVFSLPSTGQKEERFIIYRAHIQTSSMFSKSFWGGVLFVIALLVLPLFFCARLLDLPRRSYPEEVLEGYQGTPEAVVSSLVGGSGSLVSGSGEHTPPHSRILSRTSPPQPYTDYVSRTIEKTPYYSREGIRRFDPSRTY